MFGPYQYGAAMETTSTRLNVSKSAVCKIIPKQQEPCDVIGFQRCVRRWATAGKRQYSNRTLTTDLLTVFLIFIQPGRWGSIKTQILDVYEKFYTQLILKH